MIGLAYKNSSRAEDRFLSIFDIIGLAYKNSSRIQDRNKGDRNYEAE